MVLRRNLQDQVLDKKGIWTVPISSDVSLHYSHDGTHSEVEGFPGPGSIIGCYLCYNGHTNYISISQLC